MSLFRDSLRPPPVASDEAVRRYLVAIRAELEPDPLFRRRLRGVVVNRFVAAREAVAVPSARSASAMGRVGRACLYASVVVAMSVSGVMAASQGALPGDALYPVKRQVEELRAHLLPSQYQDELAAYSLSQRVSELGRLVERGEWERAAGLAEAVRTSYDVLFALTDDDASAPTGVLRAQLAMLTELMDRLPARAQAAIERAMEGAPGLSGSTPHHGPSGAAPLPDANSGRASGPGTAAGGGSGTDAANNSGGDDQPATPGSPPPRGGPSPTPEPIATPEPTPKPKPSPSAKGKPAPTGSAAPEASEIPEPGPEGEDSD